MLHVSHTRNRARKSKEKFSQDNFLANYRYNRYNIDIFRDNRIFGCRSGYWSNWIIHQNDSVLFPWKSMELVRLGSRRPTSRLSFKLVTPSHLTSLDSRWYPLGIWLEKDWLRTSMGRWEPVVEAYELLFLHLPMQLLEQWEVRWELVYQIQRYHWLKKVRTIGERWWRRELLLSLIHIS